MGQKDVIKKLKLYKLLVSDHFDIDKIVLFGSYARGKQREDSDIDVAVIVNSVNSDFFTYAPLLWKLSRQVDNRIEPVLFINGKDPSGFLQEIIKSGLTI
jgi:predicted nucleotidyltransferase